VRTEAGTVLRTVAFKKLDDKLHLIYRPIFSHSALKKRIFWAGLSNNKHNPQMTYSKVSRTYNKYVS
jgi:hypothetical protein